MTHRQWHEAVLLDRVSQIETAVRAADLDPAAAAIARDWLLDAHEAATVIDGAGLDFIAARIADLLERERSRGAA
jgi:hypothetical protein